MHPGVQWELVSEPVAANDDDRPWTYDPEVGQCPLTVRQVLLERLKPYTSSSHCEAAIWRGWGNLPAFPEVPELRLPHREYLLLTCEWSAVAGSIFGGVAEDIAPSLWWPADRAWCVATEIDYRWTYVGGSRECIREIMADSRLETLAATPTDIADYSSDDING